MVPTDCRPTAAWSPQTVDPRRRGPHRLSTHGGVVPTDCRPTAAWSPETFDPRRRGPQRLSTNGGVVPRDCLPTAAWSPETVYPRRRGPQRLSTHAGVVPRDCRPTAAIASYLAAFVCNIHGSDKEGQHWISMYLTKVGRGEYFYSYDLPPQHDEFINFLRDNCASEPAV